VLPASKRLPSPHDHRSASGRGSASDIIVPLPAPNPPAPPLSSDGTLSIPSLVQAVPAGRS
jgi:hypothetical protein